MQLLRICIPFVFILTIISTNLIDLHYKSNNTALTDLFLKSTIDCITVITNKYMPCGSLITLISTITYMDALTKLLSDKNCYNFVIRSFQTQDWLIWSDMYITSIKNFSEFNSSFKNLSRDTAWNPKAQFIILIYEIKRSEHDYVFRFLLQLNIFNVFLVTKSERNKLQVNTYNPFHNNACGRSFDKVINIDCENFKSIGTNNKYLENQFRNCTIALIGAEDIPNFIYPTNKEYSFIQKNINGLEQYMLSNIAKQENLTLKYILAGPGVNRGNILPNWTVTGSLGYLDNNTVDIAVGGFLLMRNRMRLFDSIWGYKYAAFHVFTPARGDFIWKKVYQQFSATTWILISLSFCLVSIISIFTGKYFVGLVDKKNLTLKLYGYFFGNTNAKLIRVMKLRIIIIIWIWFTFFITNFYNTALYCSLTAKSNKKVKFFNKTLDTLPFKPCISDNTRAYFQYRFNETLPGKSTDICKNTNTALDTVANNNEFYALEMKYQYNIREFKYIDEEGNRKLDSFRYTDYLMSAIYTRRGFILQKKFQRYSHYHTESGLLKHHAKIIYHRYNIHNKPLSQTFVTWNISDFRIHFSILCLGYIISLICFIIEIKC